MPQTTVPRSTNPFRPSWTPLEDSSTPLNTEHVEIISEVSPTPALTSQQVYERATAQMRLQQKEMKVIHETDDSNLEKSILSKTTSNTSSDSTIINNQLNEIDPSFVVGDMISFCDSSPDLAPENKLEDVKKVNEELNTSESVAIETKVVTAQNDQLEHIEIPSEQSSIVNVPETVSVSSRENIPVASVQPSINESYSSLTNNQINTLDENSVNSRKNTNTENFPQSLPSNQYLVENNPGVNQFQNSTITKNPSTLPSQISNNALVASVSPMQDNAQKSKLSHQYSVPLERIQNNYNPVINMNKSIDGKSANTQFSKPVVHVGPNQRSKLISYMSEDSYMFKMNKELVEDEPPVHSPTQVSIFVSLLSDFELIIRALLKK